MLALSDLQKVAALLLATVPPAVVVLVVRDALRKLARELKRRQETRPRGFDVLPPGNP